MGWAWRNGRRHYYRSQRVNGRVTKTYLGCGEAADGAAREVESRRQERARLAEESLAGREGYAAAVGPLLELCRLTDELLRHALDAAGYHRHSRGPWRKRRDGTHANG
jgi:hypothetical protein